MPDARTSGGQDAAPPMLPAVLVLTDRRQASAGLVATVAATVAGGARAVLLREKDLPAHARWSLAQALRQVLDPVGARLLVAGPDVDLARAAGAAGVHLAADDPWPAPAPDLVVGRSCHDDADLRRAGEEGATYATVSPVFPSPSKPGYGPALTTAGLARLAASTALPLFALGGITPASVAPCLAAGASGVAVMGAVMAADDPAAATRALTAAARVGASSP